MTYDFATRIKQIEAELAALKIAHASGQQATVYDSTVSVKDADATAIGSFTVNQSTASTLTIPTATTSKLGLVKVDDTLSSSSTNPVQNKTINTALGSKADTSSLAPVATSGLYSDLTGTPTIPTVSATQILSSGTKIGTVTVNGTDTDFYAPSASAGLITFGTDSSYWYFDRNTNQGTTTTVNLPSADINRVESSYSAIFSSAYSGTLTFGAQLVVKSSTTYFRRYGFRTGSFSSGEGNYNAGDATFTTAFVTGSGNWNRITYKQTALRVGDGNQWMLMVDVAAGGNATTEHYDVQCETTSSTIAPGVYVRSSPFSPSSIHREGSMWVG